MTADEQPHRLGALRREVGQRRGGRPPARLPRGVIQSRRKCTPSTLTSVLSDQRSADAAPAARSRRPGRARARPDADQLADAIELGSGSEGEVLRDVAGLHGRMASRRKRTRPPVVADPEMLAIHREVVGGPGEVAIAERPQPASVPSRAKPTPRSPATQKPGPSAAKRRRRPSRPGEVGARAIQAPRPGIAPEELVAGERDQRIARASASAIDLGLQARGVNAGRPQEVVFARDREQHAPRRADPDGVAGGKDRVGRARRTAERCARPAASRPGGRGRARCRPRSGPAAPTTVVDPAVRKAPALVDQLDPPLLRVRPARARNRSPPRPTSPARRARASG